MMMRFVLTLSLLLAQAQAITFTMTSGTGLFLPELPQKLDTESDWDLESTHCFFYFTGAHKLQSFGLAGTATKRAKRGYKATTASNWVKVKPLRAKSAAQIKTRRAPNADSNGR
ncbi:BZ3501_MvSof-1269-A2-R1_Chr12-1g03360 [Microbotryum saponariae]|nr:BZ3501_MvSof-1269-A2-R1_Chr12-1g03360 [Microbotryum saponariae]